MNRTLKSFTARALSLAVLSATMAGASALSVNQDGLIRLLAKYYHGKVIGCSMPTDHNIRCLVTHTLPAGIPDPVDIPGVEQPIEWMPQAKGSYGTALMYKNLISAVHVGKSSLDPSGTTIIISQPNGMK